MRLAVFGAESRVPQRGRCELWRLALFLFAGFLLFQSPAAAQVKEVRRVLIIYGVGVASPAAVQVHQAIMEALEDAPFHIELYSEYLEPILFSAPASQEELRQEFIRKYRDRAPDVIIAVGPSPIKFMLDAHERFFPNIPIVFCASTQDQIDNKGLDAHFTGAWRTFDSEKTLTAALRLQPHTNHVVVVGGVSGYDRRLQELVKERLHSYESKFDFTYLTNLEMPALLDRVKSLPKNTIILYTAISEDAAGRRFIDETQSLPLVLGAADAPVFVMEDTFVSQGAVGGFVTPYTAEGQVAGETVVKILKGDKLQEIPIVSDTNAYLFDGRALQRWGFQESDLPPGSIVLNHQPTFWEAYKRYVIVGMSLLFAQALIIVGLLWQRAQKKKLEAALLRSSEQLRMAMDAGKSVGWDLEVASGRLTWFGDLRTMFGIPSDKFIGHVGDFYRNVHAEDRQRVSEAVAEARQNGSPYATEFRIVWPDGKTRWVVARGKFDYAANGDAKRMLGMAVDITDRKMAEEALKRSEEKFSKAFRESPLAFTLTRVKDNRLIEVNETFERMTGWGRHEVIGRTSLDMGIWADPDQRSAFLNHVLADGSVRNFDILFRTKHGELRTGLGSSELIEIDSEPCIISLITDVTEHKQVQEKLRISQNLLHGIVASAMDAIIAVDGEQRILVFNEAAEKMFACPAQDAIGSFLSRFIPERFRAEQGEYIWRFGEAGGATRAMGALGALTALRAHGEEFPIEASISQTDGGGKKLFTVIIRDITERKRAEEAQFLHAAIVDSSEDAIISQDLQGVILSWNAGARRLFGFTETEVLGQALTIIIPEELRGEENEILQKARIGEHIEHFETARLTKSGKRLDISLTVSPLRDWTGKVVGVSKIARDVTQSKMAEAALRESEERFRLVANTAPVMIWMSGPDRLCTYFNQPWLEFTGRSIHAEMGNGWAEGVHSEDLERCMEKYTRAFDQRETFQMEYRLRRHDGEYRWILDLGVPRWNADGTFAGFIGSCLDVTERKRAEEALSSVSRRLIEAHEEERTRIARDLHDDINQRMSLFAVNLEQLKQGLPGSAVAIRRGLEEMHDNVTDLASDVQTLSHRLHSSKLEYLGIAAASSSYCKELSQRQKVEIDFDTEGISMKNVSYEIALCLFRVLQEALQNAVKHSGSEQIQVSLVGTLNDVELCVRDSGVGFDFEEGLKGQGLGLVSMKERLKLVNGELLIDSRPQFGTLVRATVPLLANSMSAQA